MKANKEKLELYIHVLDILLLCFAVIVAFGVTGEYLFQLSSFGRFTAIGVDGEAVLGFLSFLFSRRLRAIQDIEIAALRRDVAEANRLAEQDRLARIKIEERLAPRRVIGRDKQHVIALLRSSGHRIIDIVKYKNDAEVATLVHDISEVLTESGWTPTLYEPASSEPIVGITVEIDPQNPPTLQAGTALVSTLSIAGLSASGPNSSLPRNNALTAPPGTRPATAAVRLTIGRK